MVTCSNLKVLLQSLYIRTHLQLFFTTYNIAIHEMLVCLAKKITTGTEVNVHVFISISLTSEFIHTY